MGWIAKPLAAALLVVCVPTLFAQQSASRYGQRNGFGGGGSAGPNAGYVDGLFRGGGGMSGGAPPGNNAGLVSGDRGITDVDAVQGKPDDERAEGVWDKKSAILTPGDRVEYRYKLKKNETIMAGATSDAFDPALALTDPSGKIVVQNDDRAPGDQSPFIIFRAPEEGVYTIRVFSARSVSGGKFEVRKRSFLSLDIAPGAVVTDVPHAADDPQGRYVLRLRAKKGKFYDLSMAILLLAHQQLNPGLARVIGPTGVSRLDYSMVQQSNNYEVFRALSDGDYYLEYMGMFPGRLSTDFREFDPTPITTSGAFKKEIDKNGVALFEMPVKSDQIVRTVISGNIVVSSINGPIQATGETENEHKPQDESPLWLGFQANVDSEDDVTRIFRVAGTLQILVHSVASNPATVTIANSESLPSWKSGVDEKGSLKVGETRLFLFDASKSELVKVYAHSKQFAPSLEIFSLTGNLENRLQNRLTQTASDDLYFPDAGKFIVRLMCMGNGGSGEFEMKRDTVVAASYKLGALETLKLTGENFGLYTINLEAGKRYQLTTDQPDKPLAVDLLDADGQFLSSQEIRFDKVDQQYFVPTRSGPHRLWLRGEPGDRKFKLELHVAPTLGG